MERVRGTWQELSTWSRGQGGNSLEEGEEGEEGQG